MIEIFYASLFTARDQYIAVVKIDMILWMKVTVSDSALHRCALESNVVIL